MRDPAGLGRPQSQCGSPGSSRANDEKRGFMCNTMMMLTLIVALALDKAMCSSPSSFESWKFQHGKRYATSADEGRALENFVASAARVAAINKDPATTWTAALTHFADLSASEFKQQVLLGGGVDGDGVGASGAGMQKAIAQARGRHHGRHPKADAVADAPAAFDWRDLGGVSPVQDQGGVGTCWAFSTVGNVEGQHFLQTNTTLDLSDEYLVDCDGSSDPDAGHADCGVFGGWPYLAYDFIVGVGGLPSESDIPYCAGTGECHPCMQGPVSLCGPPPYYCDDEESAAECPPNDQPVSASISGWVSLEEDEAAIAAQLPSVGPLSALLDATELQFYSEGVWNGYVDGSRPGMGCRDYLNHAVLIVGYGAEAEAGTETDPSGAYWTVKNSWSVDWGEEGYFRIARGAGMCGINTAVTSSF